MGPWWLTWHLCLYICEKCEMSRLWRTHGHTDSGKVEQSSVWAESAIGQCSGRPETAKEGHNLTLPLIPCLKKQKSFSSTSAAVFCHHVYYGLKVFNACVETGERLSKKCSGCICCSSCFILVLVRLDICPKLYTTGVSGKKFYTLKGVNFDYFY